MKLGIEREKESGYPTVAEWGMHKDPNLSFGGLRLDRVWH
jgi:hypothetical protein